MSNNQDSKPKNKLKQTISIITTVLSSLVLGVILLCLLLVSISKIKGEQPNLFGYSFMYILTDSMEPELPVGSSILVKKCTADDLKVGDYVTYLSDDDLYAKSGVRYITHKVIQTVHTDSVSGKKVITAQGIKAGAPEELVEVERVQAVFVKKTSSGVSRFFSFLLTPYGLATLICVPLLVALGIQLFSQIKKINQKEKEKTDEELLKEEIAKQTQQINDSAKEYFLSEQEKIKEFLESQKQNDDKSENDE